MSKTSIVVVGGGYAGVLTTQKLIKGLGKEIKKQEVEITLIDKNPYHTLLTELHEVAFDRTENESIKVYYKKIFNAKKVNVVLDTVSKIDYDKKTVVGSVDYKYDYLVECTGATPAFFGIEGVQEHAFPMWSFKDTQVVKNKVLDNFNRAECTTDAEEKKRLLTFVVAGAGFTGVEVVGELEEWIRRTLIFKYPTLSMDDINVHLIDGAPRILGAFGEKASKKGHKHMEKLGINIILNQFISKVTPTSVHFGDSSIDSDLVIWTSGVTCEPISKDQHDVQRGNRIPVETNLESSAKKDAYILGDIMYYIPEGKEMPVPQMVENCEHAAKIVAKNIISRIKGDGKQKVYKPFFHGAMACIGGRWGVAELKIGKTPINISGFFAMFVKHFVNCVYLITSAGFAKTWQYIKVELFNVRDRRSFIGGLLSSKSPDIYLVPLRLWLGLYWVSQGVPKVVHKIQGGWEAICVDTTIFPASVKQYGSFCESVFPQGKALFDAKWVEGAAGASGAAEEAAAVVQAVPGVMAEAATNAQDIVTNAAQVVESNGGLLTTISELFTNHAPVETAFGLGYQFTWLPDALTSFIQETGMSSLESIADLEWLMELTFDFAEAGLGLLLILGLWRNFTAIALCILAFVIGVGSFVNYGMVVEGIIFSIVGSFALIGIGGDAMPISADYWIEEYRRKRKIKKACK